MRDFYKKLKMKILNDLNYEHATRDAAEIIQAYVDLAGTLPAGSYGCDAYRRSAFIAFENWRQQTKNSGQFQHADERRLLEILAQDH